jgi:heterodisulfide reductase subunit A-like polyferredoxin
MNAKIQVVLCKCCSEMPKLLNIGKLEKLASESGNVLSVMTLDGLCDGKELAKIVAEARMKEIDRAVVLACQKKDVSPALVKAYKRAGVNEYLVEIVNIREEVILPHATEPERAQAKAERKLQAALARSRLLEPLERSSEEMKTRNVVIIGGGVAGQAAAREAAKHGVHTIILEKTGKSIAAPGVVMPHATLIGGKGYGGNFELKIRVGESVEDLGAASVVIASGGGWTTLKGALAKTVKSALPLYEFYQKLQSGLVPAGAVVFMDTPDPAGKTLKVQDYAWDETLETAMEVKKKSPENAVYVIFQEMRASGLSELLYKEAAEIGIKFVRYDRSATPKVDPKDPTVLTVKDLSQGDVLKIKLGTMVFASIPASQDNQVIAEALRIPMSLDGGIRRGSIQRGPVTTPKPGVFVCGSALFPKSKEIAAAEGEAAGKLAGEFAAKGSIEYGGVVAQVTPEKCSACLTCIRTCPYEAPFIGTATKAEIRVQACQGCGMCVGICPSKAIELHNYTDDQIMTESKTLLGGDF